jgi:molecular chaperone DnaJ
VFGDEISVPTLSGVASVKIPFGTQSGAKFRLSGLGLPLFGNGDVYTTGDEIVQLELEVPVNPEGRYRELIVELAELEKQNVTPKKKSFAEKAGA